MPSSQRFSLAVPALLAALLIGSGCAARINIAHTRPARVVLGDAPLALEVATDGQKPDAGKVMEAIVDASQGQLLNKWVAVLPVQTELDSALRQTSYAVVDRQKAQYVVRAVPVEWSFQGPIPRTAEDPGTGRLKVRVQILDPRAAGEPLLDETYWASAEATTEKAAMQYAAKRLAQVFLSDLTPTRIWNTVTLDRDDKRVRPSVKLAKEGHFEAAYAAMTDMVHQYPDSAPAHYNLAVLCESRGEYDAAEVHFGKAIRIEGKPLYYEGLERMRRSRAEHEAYRAQVGADTTP